MGSLRNPVGPLPSSIYWRRRAVLASVVALLALLAVWTVSSGGGKSSTNGKGQSHPDPAVSITPGPAGTGPAISQAPGGRAESGGGGTGTGAGSEGGGAGGAGKNGEPGSGSGSGGAAAAGSGGGQAPAPVPADSALPTCAPTALQWEVKSVKNEYEANEKPRLELITRNVSGTTCKVDLGPKQAVLTILQATSTKAVWSSADCPTGAGNAFFRLPAGGETKQPLDWDRHFSAPDQCQSPPAGSAAPDTYVVEVKSPGMPVARTSFVLKQD
ncbi:hypothetical protein ACGFYU_08055 [Streptomyces sp. NPDC048337]|uniref:hypothetical protein n=1 Tax=Streptomyces sp. NPDC048337 TaxID=3365535 RepID=UPI0037134BBD